jgi:hypothetical protein
MTTSKNKGLYLIPIQGFLIATAGRLIAKGDHFEVAMAIALVIGTALPLTSVGISVFHNRKKV